MTEVKKKGNTEGTGTFRNLGGRVFWKFQMKARVKIFMPPVIGYGYFWNHPLPISRFNRPGSSYFLPPS